MQSDRNRASKQRLLALLLAAMLAMGLPALADEAAGAAIDFALPALAGGNQRLSEHRGEVVAVLFWATFCGECRATLGQLEALRAEFATEGLVVLGVNLDRDPGAAASLAAAAAINYPTLMDVAKDVSRAYRVTALPTIVLVDRYGRVRQRLTHGNSRELRAGLARLIRE